MEGMWTNMRDVLLRKIRDEYDQKRHRAFNEAQKRKDEIYKSFPILEDIDRKIALAGIELSKTVLLKPENFEEEITKIRNKIEGYMEEKKITLKEKNLSDETFKPDFECKICNDTGYLGGIEFTNSMEKCKCYKQKIIENLYDMSNIKYRLKKENFNLFDISIFSDEKFKEEKISPRQNMKNILEACGNFCLNFGAESPSLLFHGSTGVGKTFMCNCIASELIERGKTVIYQTASNLIEVIEEHKFKKTEEAGISKENYNYLFECDLLIIDDLGTELNNSFTNSELFNIINARMISDKKTIISTNLPLADLAQTYSDRIISRIFNEFAIFKFYGKDLRF
jgi:DNA replication protein DnaC